MGDTSCSPESLNPVEETARSFFGTRAGQTELAVQMGMDRSFLSDWSGGKGNRA